MPLCPNDTRIEVREGSATTAPLPRPKGSADRWKTDVDEHWRC